MATAVVAWSEPSQDHWGDEYLQHFVATCNDDLEPVGKTYTCSNRQAAINLAWKMSKDRNLEYVDETIL